MSHDRNSSLKQPQASRKHAPFQTNTNWRFRRPLARGVSSICHRSPPTRPTARVFFFCYFFLGCLCARSPTSVRDNWMMIDDSRSRSPSPCSAVGTGAYATAATAAERKDTIDFSSGPPLRPLPSGPCFCCANGRSLTGGDGRCWRTASPMGDDRCWGTAPSAVSAAPAASAALGAQSPSTRKIRQRIQDAQAALRALRSTAD